MSHTLLIPDLSLPARPSEARARLAGAAARASGRRRLVDPATCERDYSAAEVEFMTSMQAYKIRSGRKFRRGNPGRGRSDAV